MNRLGSKAVSTLDSQKGACSLQLGSFFGSGMSGLCISCYEASQTVWEDVYFAFWIFSEVEYISKVYQGSPTCEVEHCFPDYSKLTFLDARKSSYVPKVVCHLWILFH